MIFSPIYPKINGGIFYCNIIENHGKMWYTIVKFKQDTKFLAKEAADTDIRVGDVLKMKKEHPCGSKEMQVLRIGADFKLRCLGCGHEFMTARSRCEKKVKAVIRKDEDEL